MMHTALMQNTYVRMLFIDFVVLAFNTIIPTKLVIKIKDLGLNTTMCILIMDFLTGKPNVVRIYNSTSSILTLNTSAQQGCVLSPLLQLLFMHYWVTKHSSNIIFKFVDDTTILGLITTAMRQPTERRSEVCCNGAMTMTSLLTSAKWGKLYWITGCPRTEYTLPYTSMKLLWKESRNSSFLVSTSLMTSPGPSTPAQSYGLPTRGSTFVEAEEV